MLLTSTMALYWEETIWKLTMIRAEPQTKKHLTAEEHAMRRAEMARRRKNLSEKRNEEEKVRLISLPRASPTHGKESNLLPP